MQTGIVIALGCLVAIFLFVPGLKGVGLLGGVIFGPLFFLKVEWYFVFFLVARPVFDVTIRSGFQEANLSAILIFFLVLVIIKELLVKPEYVQRIRQSDFTKGFNIIFSFFLVFAMVGVAVSPDRIYSLKDFIRFLSLLLAVNFTIGCFVSWKEDITKYAHLLLTASVVPLLFGLYQFAMNTGIHSEGLNRLFGTFAHCNVYAQFLALMLFVLIYLLTHHAGKPPRKWLYRGFLLFTAVSFYHTYTRTMWAGFAAAFVIYLLMKRGIQKKLKYLLAIAVGGIALLPVMAVRFQDLLYPAGREGRTSLQWRIDLWLDWMKDIKENIFFGRGLGMFQEEAGAMAHNDFLRLSYEAGIPGAVVFYFLLAFIVYYSLRLAARCRTDMLAERCHLAAALTVTLFISSMGINTLRSTVIMFYYLVTITVLIGSVEYALKQPPKQIAREAGA